VSNTKKSENISDELKNAITENDLSGIETSLTRLAAVLGSEYGQVGAATMFRKALDKAFLGLPVQLIVNIESKSSNVVLGHLTLSASEMDSKA
jgi:hypothetical protein